MQQDRIVKSGVGVILIRHGKVLVGRRKGSHGAGLLSFPGGGIEATDTSLAYRGQKEVEEETGIQCEVFSPDGYREDLFTTFDILSEDGTKIYVTVYLFAHYLSGGESEDGIIVKPTEPDKCEYWQWVTLPELIELIKDDKEKAWIPIRQVEYYLKQLWNQQ